MTLQPTTFNLSDRFSWPRPGDRVDCYQFTPPNPNHKQKRDWCKNPWQPPADDTWHKVHCWHRCVMVIVASRRAQGKHLLTVTCLDWPEPVLSEGVEIPLTHVELIERSICDPSQIGIRARALGATASAGAGGTADQKLRTAGRLDQSSAGIRGEGHREAPTEATAIQRSVFEAG